MKQYTKDVTIIYRDECRASTKYKDVREIWHDDDIVWILLFKGGGGVQIAFSEVLRVEQTATTGTIDT